MFKFICRACGLPWHTDNENVATYDHSCPGCGQRSDQIIEGKYAQAQIPLLLEAENF